MRTSLALGLAARFGSRLIGVSPTGLPDVILGMNSVVPDSLALVALSASVLRERAGAVAHQFEQRCAVAGFEAFESRVVFEEAVDELVRHAQCSDLVIVGQRDRSAPVEGVALDLPQQVLLHGGTPVLVVPRSGTFAAPGRCVLVAWKPRREATRAVRDALPILREADRVVLCAIAEGTPDDRPTERLDAVRLWLAAHGIRAEMRQEGGSGARHGHGAG